MSLAVGNSVPDEQQFLMFDEVYLSFAAFVCEAYFVV